MERFRYLYLSWQKWAIVVAATAALTAAWSSPAQESAWRTQVLAEGPNAPQQRVLTPDVAAIDNSVFISYIQQRTNSDEICIAVSKDSAASWTTMCFQEPMRVISTYIAAHSLEGKGVWICVGWLRLEGTGPAVYQRCASVDNLQWLSDPIRLSPEGVIAGQHRLLQSDFRGDWTGNLDNTVAPDGTFYAVWSENYNTLKAARSTDGINWEACGDITSQSGFDVRFPTVYVDDKGRVYVGATQTTNAPDVQGWVSFDGCVTWKGPANITSNSGFSEAAEFAVIGDTFYSANDDSTANPNSFDLNLSVCDVTPSNSLANCQGTRAIYKDAAWARLKTNGKNLHVVGSHQGDPGLAVYCYSADGGSTWVGDPIPYSKPNNIVIHDPDFGIVISRNNIAVSTEGEVYIVWTTMQEGKSRIMLSVRKGPPMDQTASRICAP